MNLANKLTIFRMILVPLMVIIPFLPISGDFYGVTYSFIIMDIIFVIASITDHFDGYIARSRNEVTTFGKFLDPLADKILVLAAMVLLVGFDKIPAWIPVIVLTREFLVSGLRLVAVEKGGKVIAASIWGKIKTATQMVAIGLIFIDVHSFFEFVNGGISGLPLLINISGSILLGISVIATIFSGYDYFRHGMEYFKE